MTDAVTKLKGELFLINKSANNAYSNNALQADRHIAAMASALYNQYGVTSINDIGTKTIPAVPAHYEKIDTGKKTKVSHYNPKTKLTTYTYEPVYTSKLIPTAPAYEVTINKLNGQVIPQNKFASNGEGEGYTNYNLQAVKQANGTTLYVPVTQWGDSSDWNKIAPILFLGLSLTGVGGLIGAAVGLEGAAASAFGTAAISTAMQAAANKIGDVGDVLESFAKGFAGDYLGNLVGKEIGGVLDSTFGQGDVANVIKQTVVNGTKNTIQSIVTTGKPGDALQTFASAGAAAAVPYVLGQVPGIGGLSAGSQKIIGDAVAAKLGKQPVTAAVIQSAITASGIIADSVKGLGLTPQQERLLVSGISNTATALIQNKPIDQALIKTMVKAGQDSFKELANIGVDALKKNLSTESQGKIKNSGDLSAFVEKSAADLDGLVDTISASQNRQKELQDRLLTIKGQLDPAMSEFDQAQKAQEKATSDYYSLIESGAGLQAINDQIDTVNRANERYSIASSALQNRWDKFKDETGTLNKELDTLKATIPTSIQKFNTLKADLAAAGSNLKEYNDKLNDRTEIAFVKSLAPEFDAKQYSDLHGNPPEDSYDHWLSSGMSLPINQAEQKLKDLSDNQGIADGLSKAANVPTSMIDQKAVDALSNAYSDYGDQTPSSFTVKPSAAREWATAAYQAGQNGQKTFQVTGEDGVVYTVNTPPEALSKTSIVKDKAPALTTVYGSWNPPPLSVFELPTGAKFATPEQIWNERTATMFRNPDGSYVWVQIQSARVRDQKYGISDPDEIKKLDPAAYISTLKNIPADQRPASLEKETPAILQAATSVINTLQNSGAPDVLMNGIAMIAEGAGSIAKTAALVYSVTGINAKNTSPGQVSDILFAISDKAKTSELKAAQDRFASDFNSAEGFGGSIAVIANNILENPGAFLVYNTGTEVINELGSLLVGGLAGRIAGSAAKGLSATKELATAFAKRTSIAVTEGSEIFAGVKDTFDSAYGDVYSAAIKSGKTPAQAAEMATDAALKIGAASLVTSVALNGKNPNEISSLVFNGKTNASSTNLKDSLNILVKQSTKTGGAEAVDEFFETGVPGTAKALFMATTFGEPADLGKVGAEATLASIFGLTAGASTAAGATGLSFAQTPKQLQSNLTILTNPDVAIAVDKAKKINPNDAVSLKSAVSSITDAATASGITDPTDIAYIANAANTKFAITPDEINEMYQAEGAGNPTEQVYKSLVGTGTDQVKALENARAAIDPTYVSRDELNEIAKQFNNFVVPDDVAARYTGPGKEADVLKNAAAEIKVLAEASTSKASLDVSLDKVYAKDDPAKASIQASFDTSFEPKISAIKASISEIAPVQASQSASESKAIVQSISASQKTSADKVSQSASESTSKAASQSAYQSQSTTIIQSISNSKTSASQGSSVSQSLVAEQQKFASLSASTSAQKISESIDAETQSSIRNASVQKMSSERYSEALASTEVSKSVVLSNRAVSLSNYYVSTEKASIIQASIDASRVESAKTKASADASIAKVSAEKASVVKVSVDASLAKASEEKASIAKASAEKASVVKASVEKASIEKASIAKASAEASLAKASEEKVSISKASAEKASIVKASIEKASIDKASVDASLAKASVEKASVLKASVDAANLASLEKISAERASIAKASMEKAAAAKASADASISVSIEKASAVKASVSESIAKASVEKSVSQSTKASVDSSVSQSVKNSISTSISEAVEKASISKSASASTSLSKAFSVSASTSTSISEAVEKASISKSASASTSSSKAASISASVSTSVSAAVEQASISKSAFSSVSSSKAASVSASVSAAAEQASISKSASSSASSSKAASVSASSSESAAKVSAEKASISKASAETSAQKSSEAKASIEKSVNESIGNASVSKASVDASIIQASTDRASVSKASADASMSRAAISESYNASVSEYIRASVNASLDVSVKQSIDTSVEPSAKTSAETSVNTSVNTSVDTSIDTSINTSVNVLSSSTAPSSTQISSTEPSLTESSITVTSSSTVTSSPTVTSSSTASESVSRSISESAVSSSVSASASTRPVSSAKPVVTIAPSVKKPGFSFSIPQIETLAVAAVPFLEAKPAVIGGKPEYKGILDEFFAKVNQPLASPSQSAEPEMSKQKYYEYGETPSIDDILGTQDEESNVEEMAFAKGGLADPFKKLYKSGKMRTDFRRGDAVSGPGDGQSDDIPAMLADGEFVFPADVVAALGNGSTKAGSEQLYKMMHNIRARARKAAPKELPPKALSPLEYLKRRK